MARHNVLGPEPITKRGKNRASQLRPRGNWFFGLGGEQATQDFPGQEAAQGKGMRKENRNRTRRAGDGRPGLI